MTETHNSPGDNPAGGTTAAPPPSDPTTGGPRVSTQQMRDLRRLRRSTTDSKISGVAGGLARHLDVDPTLVRVLFVVLALFGGAGFMLYGALWLLVPLDGRDRAVISTGEETKKVLLIIAGVIATLTVLGHAWSGWWGPGIPFGIVIVAVVLYLVSRDQRRAPAAQVPYGPSYQPAYGPASYASPTGPTTDTATDQVGAEATFGPEAPRAEVPPPPRPAWTPPPYVPPAPRPRRTGLVLFWPTLALVAVALGTLGLFDNAGTHVVDAAYPALALTVIGAMLVIGAFVGRPGGLALLGIIAAIALGIGSATGGFQNGRTLNYSPANAAEVRSTYQFDNGELSLDLSRISDRAALDGDTVTVRGGAGRIEVVVPRNLNVDVESRFRVAGGYQIGDASGGGFQATETRVLAASPGDPTIHLNLDLRVGEIDVRQQ